MITSICITFCAFVGLFVLSVMVARFIDKDLTEIEAVDDAEWIIIDHCNSMKKCEDCDKYIKNEEEVCRYKCYSPWEWRKDNR